MKKKIDTIIALATPPGYGSVGILRISGPLSKTVAYALLGKLPMARQAEYLIFRDKVGNTLDKGIALFFPSPHSFTGEDILELQGHGGPVILDLLLQHIISIPCIRIARPGEFSERAFLNEKIDLIQAEAIADMIHASSEQAARLAINSMQGIFSEKIHTLVKDLTNLRVCVEAEIDFPDENIDFFSHINIESRIKEIIATLNRIRLEGKKSSFLKEGMKVVITGKPNAGKSSLMNALVGRSAAIVTSIPGTTCDVLREHIVLDGIPFHIIDTAGLRDAENEIEKIGIENAWFEIEQADHVVLIVDGSDTPISHPAIIYPELIERMPSGIPLTLVRNKADLTGENITISQIYGYSLIILSAQSGIGIDLFLTHLKKTTCFTGNSESNFLARRRHLEAIDYVEIHLKNAMEQLITTYSVELLAEELRLAQQASNEILGQSTSNDLLNKIFSSFCIGK